MPCRKAEQTLVAAALAKATDQAAQSSPITALRLVRPRQRRLYAWMIEWDERAPIPCQLATDVQRQHRAVRKDLRQRGKRDATPQKKSSPYMHISVSEIQRNDHNV